MSYGYAIDPISGGRTSAEQQLINKMAKDYFKDDEDERIASTLGISASSLKYDRNEFLTLFRDSWYQDQNNDDATKIREFFFYCMTIDFAMKEARSLQTEIRSITSRVDAGTVSRLKRKIMAKDNAPWPTGRTQYNIGVLSTSTDADSRERLGPYPNLNVPDVLHEELWREVIWFSYPLLNLICGINQGLFDVFESEPVLHGITMPYPVGGNQETFNDVERPQAGREIWADPSSRGELSSIEVAPNGQGEFTIVVRHNKPFALAVTSKNAVGGDRPIEPQVAAKTSYGDRLRRANKRAGVDSYLTTAWRSLQIQFHDALEASGNAGDLSTPRSMIENFSKGSAGDFHCGAGQILIPYGRNGAPLDPEDAYLNIRDGDGWRTVLNTARVSPELSRCVRAIDVGSQVMPYLPGLPASASARGAASLAPGSRYYVEQAPGLRFNARAQALRTNDPRRVGYKAASKKRKHSSTKSTGKKTKRSTTKRHKTTHKKKY